jgi:sigma-B regulation protein RsbU (phosphoserine phosphatase)
MAVLSGSVLVYVLIFAVAFSFSSKIIQSKVEAIGENVVTAVANKVDIITEDVANITEITEFFLQQKIDYNLIPGLLKTILTVHSNIFGISMSFEPYSALPHQKYFSPYCLRMKDKVDCVMLGGDAYDYFEMGWYKHSKDTGKASWTEAYTDPQISGATYIISHSAPIYQKDGEKEVFRGIVSADISVEWLQQTISEAVKVYGGYAFVVSGEGNLLTFPQKEFKDNISIRSIAREKNDEKFISIADEIVAGRRGASRIIDPLSGKRAWIFYRPVGVNNWSAGVVFIQDELLADIISIEKMIIITSIFGLILLVTTTIVLSKRITKPLIMLSTAARRIARGEMDAAVPSLGRKDEVGTLAGSFNLMQTELKKYISKLTISVAKQERIENELKIAHDIQQGIVPTKFHAFGKSFNVTAFGTLQPALEVGGDLFDTFEIDEKRTLFVVGDVSDKGVHAALMMAVVSTILRSVTKHLKNPDDIMRILNREIIKRNNKSMFVTLFCAILNNDTGVFRFSNAGHPPPILVRKNCDPSLIIGNAGMPLGVKPDAEFSWQIIELSDDDKVVIYTDGVTEAANISEEFFGEERLLSSIKQNSSLPPRIIVQDVIVELKKYSANRPPSDDIAMLAFSFKAPSPDGKPGNKEIEILNRPEEIERMSLEIGKFATDFGASPEEVLEMQLAAEEIVINIINFAHEDALNHTIYLSLKTADRKISITIIDDGSPFDPTKAVSPDIEAPLEKRDIGGLGIFLGKKMTGDVAYERVGSFNRLTLSKFIKGDPK